MAVDFSLLVLSILAMFLPLARFPEDALGMLQRISTSTPAGSPTIRRLYDRYVAQGDPQDKLDKQKAKVEKAQATLDEYLAQAEELKQQGSGSALTYELLPQADLPAQLQFDQTRINESRIYQPQTDQYRLLVYLAAGLLAGALLLMLLGRARLVSKAYTASGLLNLGALLVLLYALLRVRFRSKALYRRQMTGLQFPLILLPLLGLC